MFQSMSCSYGRSAGNAAVEPCKLALTAVCLAETLLFGLSFFFVLLTLRNQYGVLFRSCVVALHLGGKSSSSQLLSHPSPPLPAGGSQYGQQQEAYQGPPPPQGYAPQQQYPGQQGYAGQQQAYGEPPPPQLQSMGVCHF